MNPSALDLKEDGEKVQMSPHMKQYFTLRGRAISLLDAKKKAEAHTSIKATLDMDGSAKQKINHLKVATPQDEIDFIRALEHQDDAARQAWMDRWVTDEVSNVIDRLAQHEPVSKLVIGEALVAGLINPRYMPDGRLGPVFAAQAKAHNIGNYFKLSITGARKNGMIPANMSDEDAEKALWDNYNTIAGLVE